MNEWIGAAIAVAAGIVIGTVISRLLARTLGQHRNERLHALAGPVASLVLSVAVVIGLVVALGIVNPESLDQIPEDLVTFLPRLLAAVVVMLGGNVLATLARAAAARALAGSGAATTGPAVARISIMVTAGILAADQLGVDTTIVTLAAAALLFSIGAASAMLIGLGGREVASEIAAGRAWRQMLRPGDHIEVATRSGRIVELHPTAVEIDVDGRRVFVPNRHLLAEDVISDPATADGTAGSEAEGPPDLVE